MKVYTPFFSGWIFINSSSICRGKKLSKPDFVFYDDDVDIYNYHEKSIIERICCREGDYKVKGQILKFDTSELKIHFEKNSR